MSSSFEVAVFCLIFDKVLYSFFCLFLQSYEEYVEIHSRCMRQLGLPDHHWLLLTLETFFLSVQVIPQSRAFNVFNEILKTLKNLWSCFHEVNMQRVAPKSYQQAAGVVFVSRKTLNHLGQQTHGFWAKSGLCSNTLNNCFNQEVGDEKSILELEFLI
ncbi:unnamed protein product [Brassica napus]|uniref:(rape) hypothetical protein n=1 Tax=Brassica napus TaxID=3708 RepID=A0A816IEQ7_BRANA|nr:unnamed protein product [Brassica napus]